MNRECIDFARAHENEDTARLLLSAARYPGIDMPAVVQQIEGLRTAREKWPRLLECGDFRYPPRLNREQASSEAAADYKAALVAADTVADLTGGMGVDTLAFARQAREVRYVERDATLCELMEHNHKALGLDNIHVHCADSIDWLRREGARETKHDLLYLDPARRDSHGRKVAAFEDCTPNLLDNLPLLRSRCRWLLVKASPMIDIDLARRQLGAVSAVHIVGVRGECKEVLFLCCGDGTEPPAEPTIHCVSPSGTFTFTPSEEAAAEGRYCQTVGRYLYEPNATLMKGGPFKLLAHRYSLEGLGRNTHLYTSRQRIDAFPGRVFEVLRELQLNRRSVAAAIPQGRAHVVTRNYPVEAAALQCQLGLREGGDLFIVATSIGNRRCGFLCKK